MQFWPRGDRIVMVISMVCGSVVLGGDGSLWKGNGKGTGGPVKGHLVYICWDIWHSVPEE